jgi:SAM-dependent methyltransferase
MTARDGATAALGRAPFLVARDRVYDDRYYRTVDPETEHLYRLLVDTLWDLRRPTSVVDVGCGTGFMLARFASHGVDVTGVEGSSAAIRRSRLALRIVRANLERGVPQLGKFDICLCIEVAEHLRPASGPRLVEGLAALSDLVVFTAAHPGQSGVSHIHLRPRSYWEAQFSSVGFVVSSLERDVRDKIAAVPQPSYIHANLMVFERESGRAAN